MSYNQTTGKASCDRCGQWVSVGWNTDKMGGFTCGDCLEGRTPLKSELEKLRAENERLTKENTDLRYMMLVRGRSLQNEGRMLEAAGASDRVRAHPATARRRTSSRRSDRGSPDASTEPLHEDNYVLSSAIELVDIVLARKTRETAIRAAALLIDGGFVRRPKLGMIPSTKEEIDDARESLRPILIALGCKSPEDHGSDADGDLYSDVECLRQLVEQRPETARPDDREALVRVRSVMDHAATMDRHQLGNAIMAILDSTTAGTEAASAETPKLPPGAPSLPWRAVQVNKYPHLVNIVSDDPSGPCDFTSVASMLPKDGWFAKWLLSWNAPTPTGASSAETARYTVDDVNSAWRGAIEQCARICDAGMRDECSPAGLAGQIRKLFEAK